MRIGILNASTVAADRNAPRPHLEARVQPSLASIPAADWNALDLGGVPFLHHAYLAGLEQHGAVGVGTGWLPCHVVVYAGSTLVGALPLYSKTHSWGEFVFDFSWAEAYTRHGLGYYPKLVSATPFTPATGPRLLVHPQHEADPIRHALLAGARALLATHSSLHFQFPSDADADWLKAQGLLSRIDCQFHWTHQGYADFDAFLATFTAEKRKKAKRERRRIAEASVVFEWRAGDTLSPALWSQVYALKASTFHRHGHEPYLPQTLFESLGAHSGVVPLVLLAWRHDLLVATAIFFASADTLYGRYWGSSGDYHSLHFEACYYQGIEYCIQHGIRHFEPGTQGEHKVARGFVPTLTHSMHDIKDPRFKEAIAQFLEQERAAVHRYAEAVADHVPYRHTAATEIQVVI